MTLSDHLRSLGIAETEWKEAKQRHAMRDAHLRQQLTRVLSLISAELAESDGATGSPSGFLN